MAIEQTGWGVALPACMARILKLFVKMYDDLCSAVNHGNLSTLPLIRHLEQMLVNAQITFW